MKSIGLISIVAAPIFALAAAGLNYMYLTQKPPEVKYLQLKSDVKYGQVIESDLLSEVSLPASLQIAAIKAEEKGIAIKQTATRDYRKGDLLLVRDFTADRRTLKLGPDEEGLQLKVSQLQLSPVRIQVGDDIAFAVASVNMTEQPKRIGTFAVIGINELVDTPVASLTKLGGKSSVETLTLKVRLVNNQLAADAIELLRASQEDRILAPLLKN